MARAVFPGSFDIFTNGHLDVAIKAAKMFDELIIYVGVNPSKKPMFTLEERIDMILRSVEGYLNIKVTGGDEVIVNYCNVVGANALIKSFRSFTDVEYETKIAMINKALNPNVETALIVADPRFSHLSSSYVKELLKLDPLCPEIKLSVPPPVYSQLMKKL